MGLDLKLLPVECDTELVRYSHTILSCPRRRALFDSIKELEKRNYGASLACYLAPDKDGNVRYGETTEDSYGKPIQYVTAQELLKLSMHFDVCSNDINKAIWSYLSKLPPETKIILYWY